MRPLPPPAELELPPASPGPLSVSPGEARPPALPAAPSPEPAPVEAPRAGLVLRSEEVRHLAKELVQAVAATYPERLTRARADGRWETHLGEVIREAWGDFRAALPNAVDSDEHFRQALNQVLVDGQEIF